MLLLIVSGCAGGEPDSSSARVAQVVDGDTIRLADGQRVRLVQIDAPEARPPECFGRSAGMILRQLLPEGTRIRLEYDSDLDKVDRFGRGLAYVFDGETNVNLAMVLRGAATPYFFRGDRGRYARQLVEAALRARADRRGLWAACPATKLDPSRGFAAS